MTTKIKIVYYYFMVKGTKYIPFYKLPPHEIEDRKFLSMIAKMQLSYKLLGTLEHY